MNRYMVIETFLPGCRQAVYDRFHTRGRMLPDGLVYVDSWLEQDGDRCFQLMETDNPALFEPWTSQWRDLVRFEVIALGQKPGAPRKA